MEVRLESSEALAAPITSVVGNALIADIPNAALALAEGNEFQTANPAAGIALVSVMGLSNGQVRVSITGTDAPPTATLNPEAQGLVLTVLPGIEAATTPEEAIQVTVTGELDTGYTVDEATTATLTDTPLRDMPQSIQVIPREVIEEQQVIQIQDALRNVSGVQQTNTFGGSRDSYIIRGFDQFRGAFLRNGFREGGLSSPPVETANLERIEAPMRAISWRACRITPVVCGPPMRFNQAIYRG
ncbi:TonB-dependent receptor plug domain-containing protein [Romeria aff. gracilis LEGE 07310]|uniref:TonB-dependent receptor plug domain-containing protein n=1 Tax=Vasconcelosia minhoensis LEGE 07310 TaxID=915328 RepID=A0A8J7AJL1_9CYAN|nr:TonB-dependent receptor plug domain-containing protein [Romeria aff. gracilis LEGE 07310]